MDCVLRTYAGHRQRSPARLQFVVLLLNGVCDALQGKVGLCRLGSESPDLRLDVLSRTALPTERSLELVILPACVVQTRKKLRDMLQRALWNSCLQVGTSRLQGMRFHAAMGLSVPFESSIPLWRQVSFSH